MTNTFQIEQVSYDIIHQAINLSPHEKSKLYGFVNSYVAVKTTASGQHEVLMDTLGKRDQCHQSLLKMNVNTHTNNSHLNEPSANYRRPYKF